MPMRSSALSRDLDLDREVGRRVDLEIDVVRVRDAVQIAEVEALVRLEALIEILPVPGGRARRHDRDVELPGKDPHELAEEGFLSFMLR